MIDTNIKREDIVNVNPTVTEIVIKENDKVCHYYCFNEAEEVYSGNIYVGKVTTIHKGIDATFVDIGIPQSAYLSGNNLVNNLYISNLVAYNEEQPLTPLNEGRDVIVQVVKEPFGSKGPKVTMNVTVPGNYTVLSPFSQGVGVSTRITDEEEKNRLREIGEKIRPEGMGVIIRTDAKGLSEEEITNDLNFVLNKWEQIDKLTESGKIPRLIYKEFDLIEKISREYIDSNTETIYCNSNEICEQLKKARKENGAKIRFYNDEDDELLAMFKIFEIQSQIDIAKQRKVWLASGAYLIFDKAEALTVIDVNSGKFTSEKDNAKAILAVNHEAAEEIVRQIKLRNIGGIIIVDFIDMVDEMDKEELVEKLRGFAANDPNRLNIVGITQLGLVEMTRKRAGKPL
jgi:ribonuclease G